MVTCFAAPIRTARSTRPRPSSRARRRSAVRRSACPTTRRRCARPPPGAAGRISVPRGRGRSAQAHMDSESAAALVQCTRRTGPSTWPPSTGPAPLFITIYPAHQQWVGAHPACHTGRPDVVGGTGLCPSGVNQPDGASAHDVQGGEDDSDEPDHGSLLRLCLTPSPSVPQPAETNRRAQYRDQASGALPRRLHPRFRPRGPAGHADRRSAHAHGDHRLRGRNFGDRSNDRERRTGGRSRLHRPLMGHRGEPLIL